MRQYLRFRCRSTICAGIIGAVAIGAVAGTDARPAQGRPASAMRHHAASAVFTSRVFASGLHITHPTDNGPAAIEQPDDITFLQGDIFVGFQNGIGPQGQASATGNRASTIVEFTQSGHKVRTWNIVGKCDGLTADPNTRRVIATVNEDAHSSLYLIDPTGIAVHYRYSKPLPSKGGTDAISIYHGKVLISGSAPGTTGAAAPRPSYPAVYAAAFRPSSHTVTMTPVFFDEAPATIANTGSTLGQRIHLGLTDPDSNEVVPPYAVRFAGDFMLTSQGDQEQIFVADLGGSRQSMSALSMTASVDDTVWPSDRTGAIYASDNVDDTIYKITGPFARGAEYVADTPCDQNDAPSTCPRPGFPANFLGRLNVETGRITRVHLFGPAVQPQGMLYRP